MYQLITIKKYFYSIDSNRFYNINNIMISGHEFPFPVITFSYKSCD